MSESRELRKAARTLRKRAEGATPGPWMSKHHGVFTEEDRLFRGICHVSMTTGRYQSCEVFQ